MIYRMAEKPEKKKTSEEWLEDISKKLDKLVGVLAIVGKTPKEQVQILYRFDFSIEETMNLTNLTENIVKKERAKLKKK
jgi:hypothetical protein